MFDSKFYHSDESPPCFKKKQTTDTAQSLDFTLFAGWMGKADVEYWVTSPARWIIDALGITRSAAAVEFKTP